MANRTVTNLTAVLQMNNTKFKKGLSSSEKAMKGFQKQIKAIGGMMAGAFAVGSLVSFGKEAVKVAAKAEGIRTAFDRLNQPGLLDNLKKATRETVSEVQLMQAAVRADNFKIPLGKLATFFEFATSRAIQTGESVEYLTQSIIDGIGRKSTLVMDNLGISAVELQEEIKKVGDFGLAAANIIERGMKSMGEVLDTTATKAAQLAARFEDIKEKTGSALISGLVGLSDWFAIRFNPEVAAANLSAKAFAEVMEDVNKSLRGDEMANRIALMKKHNLEIINAREEYNKLMSTVKTADPFTGFGTGEHSQRAVGAKGHGDKIFGLDWATDPSITNGMQSITDMISLMDEQTMEWLEDMDEDMKSEFFPNIDKASLSVKNLGQSVGVMLVSSFDDLGFAITRSLGGAEGAIKSLGEAVMQNLGNILIIAGVNMGPAGLPLILAGAALQLGSGILRGVGNKVDTATVAQPGYSHNIEFGLSGRNLKATMNANNRYSQMVT